jgi:hypothetical protein
MAGSCPVSLAVDEQFQGAVRRGGHRIDRAEGRIRDPADADGLTGDPAAIWLRIARVPKKSSRQPRAH